MSIVKCTSAVDKHNATLSHNTDSTPNANNSTSEADDLTDALSEASIQQQQTKTLLSVLLSTLYFLEQQPLPT